MTMLKRWAIFLFLGLIVFILPNPLPGVNDTRKYLTTGPWYPASPEELRQVLDGLFSKATLKPVTGEIKGLVGPHAGYAYSGQCAANGYKQLENHGEIERVIIMGVSHRGAFYGAAVGDFKYDSTPLGLIPIDTEITSKLAKEKFFRKDNEIMQNEHSIEAHLPFLQYIMEKNKNKGYKIVPILFGYLEPKDVERVAQILKKFVNDGTLIIASSDFTHYGSAYGYAPFKTKIKENLTALDNGMFDLIKKMDMDGYWKYREKTGITMCGFIPVGVLMSILKDTQSANKVELVDYYKSGDSGNDYTFSVSYGAFVFYKTPVSQTGISMANKRPSASSWNSFPGIMPSPDGGVELAQPSSGLTAQEKKTLLFIARQTLEDNFEGKSITREEIESRFPLTPTLLEKSGVFVTLRKHGELRGCIGNIIGVSPLWEGVRNNALNAAFEDTRFPQLKKNELSKIDIEISVMTPLKQIGNYKSIRLGTDGVVIRMGYYQAVFLPQVATETGWNLDQFLGQLCLKAGLNSNSYKSREMEFHVFQALVFSEEEQGK